MDGSPPNLNVKGCVYVSNIVDRYQQTVYDMYMQTHPNVNPSKVRQLINQLTESKLRDIPCTLHNSTTREKIETSIINTFDWIETRQPIISGNGTFFKQHVEYHAPTTKMLEHDKNTRSKKKNEMYQLKKGTVGYNNKNLGQVSIKVIMNADYGGSGTQLSPFYSCYIPPATTGSAKNITTTLICCLEFISGNTDPWAKINNINELFDMIFSVLNDNDDTRDLIIDSYTVDQVEQWLFDKTNNLSLSDKKIIRKFLMTLSDSDLTKLMLSFNPRLVLTKYLYSNVETCMSYLKAHQIDINNITEESLYVAGYGVKPPEEIADQLAYISKTINDNCVYPFILNDSEIRANEMKRIIVCVTDTDSLMLHFSSYLDDFQARVSNFRDSCIIASALGFRLFIENIIPKMVKYIASFCNIKDEYYRKKFVFKNEYAFLAMALFAKKMYAAAMFVQEGKPRDPHDVSITGLSFKKRDSAEFLEPIMTRLYDELILTTSDIQVGKLLDEFYALRKKLQNEIDKDPSYFKMLSIKDIGAYDPNKVLPEQMRGAIVWNAMMHDEEMLPMDRVIVIPLSFTLLREYSATNSRVAEILRLSLIDNEKEKHNPVICLPEYYHDIPDWIACVIDKEYTIDKLLTPFKQILGLFDVNMCDTRGGMIPSRMIFI